MSDAKKLLGRVALVTGAGKRLGRAVALRLAAEGADVAVHYGKSEAEARAVVGEIEAMGRRAAAFSAELTDVLAIQKLVNDVAGHFGRLDILINSAANFLETKFGATTEETLGCVAGHQSEGAIFLCAGGGAVSGCLGRRRDYQFCGYWRVDGLAGIFAAFDFEVGNYFDDAGAGEENWRRRCA